MPTSDASANEAVLGKYENMERMVLFGTLGLGANWVLPTVSISCVSCSLKGCLVLLSCVIDMFSFTDFVDFPFNCSLTIISFTFHRRCFNKYHGFQNIFLKNYVWQLI